MIPDMENTYFFTYIYNIFFDIIAEERKIFLKENDTIFCLKYLIYQAATDT